MNRGNKFSWQTGALAVVLAAAGPGGGAEEPAHWAFQPLPLSQAPLPADSEEEESNAIDRLLFAKLTEKDLEISPEADRRTLIRRAGFDLTGLPPSRADVEAFVADPSPSAYQRLVDRLLASPAYGERWAQHWLDVARFAESDGFEFDHIRPEAWKYRDWVVEALNEDMPYDGFVRLQLAGDEALPRHPEAFLATGMLLAGPDMIDINSMEERRHNVLNEMTSTVGSVFLGLTIGCAQCHDHRTDPVLLRDFYAFRAFFANTVVAPKKAKQLATFVREPGREAPESFVLIRGDYRRRGEAVEPGFIPVLNAWEATVPPPPAKADSSRRRTVLARWLTRPEHPLTARVMANRLWQHHFGRPIVGTPNDFGLTGENPTHPELLDWLAIELIRREWSLKAMHRLMVTSRAYRQASRASGEAWRGRLAADPNNQLFSRMNRRRLEGEAIRDVMLNAAGLLNRQQGGPGVRPPLPPEVTITLLKDQWQVTKDPADHARRSLYLFVRRNLRYPMFDVFDRPDPNASCPERNVSTMAPQSLTLLNSALSMRLATATAARVAQSSHDITERIDMCYWLTVQRPADEEEQSRASAFLAAQGEVLRREGAGDAEEKALANLCLALMNTNEAVYID